MPTRRKSKEPKAPKSGLRALEAIGYMAAGAYVWQMGLWIYDAWRLPAPALEDKLDDEMPPLPLEIPPPRPPQSRPRPQPRPPRPRPPRAPTPDTDLPRVDLEQQPSPGVRSGVRSLGQRPRPTDALSDRFAMLEIEDDDNGDD